MSVTQFSKGYHEKMFPGYVSDFGRTDPEFIERFDNLTNLGACFQPPWIPV